MDTLHERLAELAGDAPTGGAPPAELWAHGKRGHRLRVAALAATVLVVSVVGTGIGVGLIDGGEHRPDVAPATGTDGLALPIEYPVGEELPDLGNTPGPLAAIWLAPPRGGDGAPEAVGLVGESGTFGTLPIDVSNPDETSDAGVALSPDGRRIAYQDQTGRLIVGDLVSGESYSSEPEFQTRAGYTWIETTLIGRVAGGGERDGWVWEPDTALKLIDPMRYELPNDALWFAQGAVGPGTRDHWVAVPGGGPRSCSPPILENWSDRSEVQELCDVLGFTPGSGLLGHWNSDRRPGGWDDPNDDNGTVVAWGAWGSQSSDDPRVLVAAGAPERVAFAVDLIAEALETTGGAS